MIERALALVIGTESMFAFRGVPRIDNGEADAVREWMIGALVESAKR